MFLNQYCLQIQKSQQFYYVLYCYKYNSFYQSQQTFQNYYVFSHQITEKDIQRACELITKSNKICVLVGAGISTNCGIPDFRSKNGLYNQKNNLNLIFPEQVFDIDYFYKRPMPFYQISNIFITKEQFKYSNFNPSFAHFFFKQLDNSKDNFLLVTQNIDDLEKVVNIKRLSQAHGSFSSSLICKKCNLTYENKAFQLGVINNQPVCCQQCGKILKPDIVFYGEDLNENPLNYFNFLDTSDLLIISGTSLVVEPVASLSQYMKDLKKPRLLINNSLVGGIKTNNKDIALLGDIDKTCQQLAKQLNIYDKINNDIQQFTKINTQITTKNNKEKLQTKYAIIMNSLISPDIYFIQIKENIYSIIQITENEEALLKPYETKADQTNKILEQFTDYFDNIDMQDIKCYNKKVKHNGLLVYAPIQGNIYFYCHKMIQSQNQNLLDEITSQQGTHQSEKYIYQDCSCLEGYLSYIHLIKYLINNIVDGKLVEKQNNEVNIEEFQYMDQCDYVCTLQDQQINNFIKDAKQFLNYHITEL